MPSRERHRRWGAGSHRPGRKREGTTEELSSILISPKPLNWHICTWKVRNTEELFPDKVSSHSFHTALYSSWLWWRGPEPSLLLKIAYSKQNGECPTLKQCQETTKQNKQHIMLFWNGQWLQDLGEKTQPFGLLLGKLGCQIKESERKNRTSDLFLSCLPAWWPLWKGLRCPHAIRGWRFWQGPTRFRFCLPCFK